MVVRPPTEGEEIGLDFGEPIEAEAAVPFDEEPAETEAEPAGKKKKEEEEGEEGKEAPRTQGGGTGGSRGLVGTLVSILFGRDCRGAADTLRPVVDQ